MFHVPESCNALLWAVHMSHTVARGGWTTWSGALSPAGVLETWAAWCCRTCGVQADRPGPLLAVHPLPPGWQVDAHGLLRCPQCAAEAPAEARDTHGDAAHQLVLPFPCVSPRRRGQAKHV